MSVTPQARSNEIRARNPTKYEARAGVVQNRRSHAAAPVGGSRMTADTLKKVMEEQDRGQEQMVAGAVAAASLQNRGRLANSPSSEGPSEPQTPAFPAEKRSKSASPPSRYSDIGGMDGGMDSDG